MVDHFQITDLAFLVYDRPITTSPKKRPMKERDLEKKVDVQRTIVKELTHSLRFALNGNSMSGCELE